MSALNFKSRFAPLVKNGTKTQTIRKPRPIKKGETVYLFTGQRTKNCERLGTGIVTDVLPLRIYDLTLGGVSLGICQIYLDDDCLNQEEFEVLATADGFDNTGDFVEFFKQCYELPFTGILIKWTLKTTGGAV